MILQVAAVDAEQPPTSFFAQQKKETRMSHPDGRTIEIVADDRERRGGVVEALRAMPEVRVRVQRLTTGDYVVGGWLVVERKRLPDLAASVVDGRLFRQMLRLLESHARCVLVLEGRGRDLARCGVSRAALQGALVTVSVLMGVPLLRARDARETAQLMLFAARQHRAFVSGGLQRHGKRPQGKRRTQIHLLQGLPGVGPERAARLLAAFGSVEAVVRAEREELERVAGIGATTAGAIRWAVREPQALYFPDVRG